jgi:hypothetical protein
MTTIDAMFGQRYGKKGTEFLEDSGKISHAVECLLKRANKKEARIIATFMTGDIFYDNGEIGRQVEKASKDRRFLLVLSDYDTHDFSGYEKIGAEIFRLQIDEPRLLCHSSINPKLWEEAVVAGDGNNYHELVYVYPNEIGKERIGRHSSDNELVKMIFEDYRQNVAKPLYDQKVREAEACKSIRELHEFMDDLGKELEKQTH